MAPADINATQLKEDGNAAYKIGDFDTALAKYTEGLQLISEPKDKAVFYKNRAAVYLKTGDYQDVVSDCDKALELIPNDPKALFRRAQAYEYLENFDRAYQDARKVQSLDSKNKDVHVLLERLHKSVQQIVEKNNQIHGKVNKMFGILFDMVNDAEKREVAANNVMSLAKERAGAELLLKEGLLQKLVPLMKTEKNSEIRLAIIRTLSELCKNVSRAKDVVHELGLPWLLNTLNSREEKQVVSSQFLFQTVICAFSGIEMKGGKKSDKKLMAENQKEVDSIMAMLVSSLTNRTLSGISRDAIVELLLRNLEYKLLDWGHKMIKMKGIEKLLEIASEMEEYHYESCIEITNNTRQIVSICLSKLYDEMYEDKHRENFNKIIEDFIKERLLTPDIEAKVRVAVVLTVLLLGPLDAGNAFVSREGVLEMLLAMANSDDELQEKVSCEVLIAAASKKDKCRSIIARGSEILKKLYLSKSDAIKVRALVGLCKLGSLGGTDASMKPFSEGASLKLAEACRRFLINPAKDKDLRRWACEGLSYLTLDAEVKEKLIEDRAALKAIVELAKSGNMNCLYGVVTTLVNLCNAYDKQEVIPEMVELAKFAKQHIPEEHELDDKDFIDKRVTILAEEGITSALVALSKTESENSKELIARIFNSICEMQELRGRVVQQGGTKALLSLAQEGTAKGKHCAAQALARIAITINPEVAFPGQRAYEVVRPLLKLLDIDCSGLENFEALMGLCNLAGMSESTRQRIIKERGLAQIEHYMFEPHELIRRAAVQCMANMCASPDIVKILEGKNDKLKYLVLCTSDEDEEIIRAAAGALCMVLSESQKLCKKVIEEVNDWEEILKFLLSHGSPEIQYRGTVIVYFICAADKNHCEKIIDTHCRDALKAIMQIENPELVLPKAREYAYKTMKLAAEHKFVDDPDAVED